MLSRVAESLYWMSRYMERTDGVLRMLKINYTSSQDDFNEFSWKPVLQIFTSLNGEAEALSKESRKVLQYMVADKENPNSVLSMVTLARENARSVQDHITIELWQCLNDFYHTIRREKLPRLLQEEDPVSVLNALIKHGIVYYGTCDSTMSRGEGNTFLNIGKFLERAKQTADILQVKLGTITDNMGSVDAIYWKNLLLSTSGYELYLKTYRSGFEGRDVVDQLMLNKDFPRSMIYSINRLHDYCERLKKGRPDSKLQQLEFVVGRLKSNITYSTVDSLLEYGLHEALMEIKTSLFEAGNALNQEYFSYR